ncbi:hypothetical protein PGT21_016738 [Puccinia graminis f. sp. tritici]|uniref:Uncharacterized protein n=1 Tax=Puccinia graminis f. sp. tritici TaxID=56615 RepID=A0A5B0N8X2_PUCGR|nr:hypothetical protein PGT21_016738 [Puccinia graminis f. sp. tritici]
MSTRLADFANSWWLILVGSLDLASDRSKRTLRTLRTLGIRSEASEQPLGPRFSLGTASRPPVNPPNPPSTSERLQDRLFVPKPP